MKLLDITIGGESSHLIDEVRRGVSSSAFGLPLAERIYLTARLNKKILYVAADFLSAKKAYTLFSQLNPRTVFFPAKEELLLYTHTGRENVSQRINALGSIIEDRADIVVLPVDALMQHVPKKELFARNVFTLKSGNYYNLEEFTRELIKAGYTRAHMLEKEGEYSLRGDILDIYTSFGNAFRCEFFGDQLESIRELDIATHLSGKTKDSISIFPATEILSDQETLSSALKIMREGIKKTAQKDYHTGVLERDIYLGKTDSLELITPYVPELCASLTDYLSKDTVIVYDEAKEVADSIGYTEKEFGNRFKLLLESQDILPSQFSALRTSAEVLADNSRFTSLAYHTLLTQNRLFKPQELFNFTSGNIPKYAHNFDMLVTDLRIWLKQGCRIVMCLRDEDALDRIGNLLYDNNLIYGKVLADTAGIYLLPIIFDNGIILNEEKLIIIGTYDILSRSRETRAKKQSEVFSVNDIGDYVVHNKHGIGRIESIEHMDGVFGAKDYIIVRYAGGDKLYVPTIEAHKLSRYSGHDDEVKLNKIGGTDFSKIKDKAKKGIKAMAFDLVKLYADRASEKGDVYDYDEKLLGEFCAKFPFSETDDQLRATAEILGDLKNGRIMDRLLCGDVGYGKTEVALRAAVACISCGRQVAFLAPTTILTEQHYRTAVGRMEEFGINIGVLSRFHTDTENKETIKKLSEGKIDIVFGTHRLLSKDVLFSNLGMLILDEEQRFGVEHKEKIKNMKKAINVLTLTATPIPRTLHMSLARIRDMSSLDTPPSERLPVRTFVTEYSDSLIVDAVNREVARGGQVFIVYNHVQSIDRFCMELKELMPQIRFLSGHGQMDSSQLESVINDFYAGKADVLIASTIIENGIDLPSANTLIVVDSDRFGLAQMYQLRGRVGRSNRLAYAYFTFNGSKPLTEDATKRLSAISEFTEFGSGYKLSMRDLEIRGAGNVLGRDQHGHMERVGYDMYLRLLSEAVDELSGKTQQAHKETRVDMQMDAEIPASYIEQSSERMYMYQKIAGIKSNAERMKVLTELNDVYGKPPKAILNLTIAALIRYFGEQINASRIEVSEEEAKIYFDELGDITKAVNQILNDSDSCVLKMQKSPIIAFDRRYKKNVINNLLEFLEKAIS